MAPEVAITGGSGFVGGDLLSRLVAQGRSVRALVRSPEAAARVESLGAEATIVDLFDADGLRDALWGTSLLFHVAGVNETCPRDVAAMDRVNVEGTRRTVEAAADAGVGRVVVTSSAAAIGEPEGTIGAEHTVHTGEYLSPYARSKHLAELAAFEAADRRGVDVVAVNPSSVQGTGRTGGSTRLLRYALTSRRPWLFETSVAIVDIADCTSGHLAAADRGRTGERYLLSGATVKVSEAVAMAARAADVTVTPRWIGEGTVRTLGRPGARLASWIRPSAGVCPALIDTLLHGHRIDASKSERDLGMTYRPLEDTLVDAVASLRREGLIG